MIAAASGRIFSVAVAATVRPGGLGNRLDAIYDWHRLYSVRPRRGRDRHDANLRLFAGALPSDPSQKNLPLSLAVRLRQPTAL